MRTMSFCFIAATLATTACSTTNHSMLKTTARAVSVADLRDPFRHQPPIMLYGQKPTDAKVAYALPGSTAAEPLKLAVACNSAEGAPMIDIDSDRTGAALWCGKSALWHVEFTGEIPASAAGSILKTEGRAYRYLPIPGISQ